METDVRENQVKKRVGIELAQAIPEKKVRYSYD